MFDNRDRSTERSSTVGRVATVAVVLALLALTADVAVSLRNVRGLAERQWWVEHTHDSLMRLAIIRASTVDAVAYSRGYMLDGDPEYLRRLPERERDVVDRVAKFRTFTSDNPVQTKNCDRLLAESQSLFQVLGEQTARRTAAGRVDAQAVTQVSVVHQRMDAIRATVDAMQDEETRLLHIRDDASRIASTVARMASIRW